MEDCTFISLLNRLIPSATDLRIDRLAIEPETSHVTLSASATPLTSPCPLCSQPSTRIHSRYSRMLADLPWATLLIRIELHVRRFFCPTPGCARTIFTERLPTIVSPWARRTQRLLERQRAVGLAMGGAAGSRITKQLEQPASRDTLLRLVRRIPEPQLVTPRLLGVDDFAFRKGRTYGTILINLEQGDPIDLLPDRTAATLCRWLQEHPGVELISRDRAGAYADGARQGAPAAIQVADRFHLLKNVAEALTRVLEAHPQALTVPALPPSSGLSQEMIGEVTLPEHAPSISSLGVEGLTSDVPQRLSRKEQERQQRLVHRQTRYAQVQALIQGGMTLRETATHLHLARGTIAKYARASACPEPQPRTGRSSLLDPYKPQLLERWHDGCHTGAILLHEIRERGYEGGRSIALDFVASIRKQQREGLGKQVAGPATERRTRPRELVWLVLKRTEQLDETEQLRLSQLRQADPEIETAIALVQAFATIVRERQSGALDGWLEEAAASGIAALRGFVAGVRRDYAAVKAGVTLSYSNGVVEGNVNRLKYLKRQMYGRAKFDLLRKRVLYAA